MKLFKQTNKQINHKLTIEALQQLDLKIFNQEKLITQSEAYIGEERVSYKSKMIKEQIKPIKAVKKHLNYELSLIECDFLY